MTHRTAISCHSLSYCSYRSVSDDVKQCRHSQCQLRSATRIDRFGSTSSAAVATGSYQPELIDNCCAAGKSCPAASVKV